MGWAVLGLKKRQENERKEKKMGKRKHAIGWENEKRKKKKKKEIVSIIITKNIYIESRDITLSNCY